MTSHDEMVQGYQAMAEEQKKIAELVFKSQSEVVPEWEQDNSENVNSLELD